MRVRVRKAATLLCGAMCSVFLTGAGSAEAEEDLRNLFLDAKPVLDMRYRFENVDQDNFDKNAKASTLRTRIGLETGRFHGIGAAFDVEWIEDIGRDSFNSTTNGRTRYPTVSDPDDEQLNQLYIISDGTIPETQLKLGRQRILWDNQRFIGNVGFRQNEQTFDSFRGTVTAIPDTAVEYTYLEEVHRIFGRDSSVGRLKLDTHGIRAQYTGFDAVTITGFSLLLDYDANSQAGLDSNSFGLLLGGGVDLGGAWRLLYEGSAAYQVDGDDNPDDFDVWYYRIEPGIAYEGIKFKAGFEVLGGDGVSAFQTPLATGHKFNGLTDQFLTTPADGLEDFYLSVDAPLPGEGWLSGLTFKAAYHQFWAEDSSDHYGWEWDAGLFKKIPIGFGNLNLGVQYASYDADDFSSDTDKLWLTVQFTLGAQTLGNYMGGG